MLALGVDPDLHSTAIALVGGSAAYPRLHHTWILRVSPALLGDRAVAEMSQKLAVFMQGGLGDEVRIGVVEGQQSYPGSKIDPQDLVRLAQVAGAAQQMLYRCAQTVLMPLPRVWKGQVPKKVHQPRIYRRMGWDFERRTNYAVPKIPGDTTKAGDWKHLGDAVGLALWGLDQFSKGQ